MTQVKDYLDSEYPKEKRKETFVIEISNKDLNGILDLKDFENLEKLNCSFNKITDIDISCCYKLQELVCLNNNLISTDFLSSLPFPEKITYLNIANNNFAESDLSFLSKFVSLEELRLGTFDENRVIQNEYNRFCGSLRPLRKMIKLGILDISNTDIDNDYGYLPESARSIIYSSKLRPDAKVKNIEEALRPYIEEDGEVDIERARINFWATYGIEIEGRLQEEIKNKIQEIKNKNQEIENKDQEIEDRDREIKNKNQEIEDRDREIEDRNRRIATLVGIGVDQLKDWIKLNEEKD
ncbi:1875_t:CDS:1, partial [Scutellospora calospora]